MNRTATVSEQKKYGEIWFKGPDANKEEVATLEENGRGAIGVMFLPRYDPKLRFNICVPVKWQHRDNAIYLPLLGDILFDHFEFLNREMQTKEVQLSYSNPLHYNIIIEYMRKWKSNQNAIQNSNSNTIQFERLKTNQLILVNGSQLEFARKTPVALVQNVFEQTRTIEVILMQPSSLNEHIVPVDDLSHCICFDNVNRILCNDNDQKSMQIAYMKIKHENIDYKYEKLKANEIKRLQMILESYLGNKVKKAMNKTNFVKFRRKQKPTRIEQEFLEGDLRIFTKYIQSKCITFLNTLSHLKITIKTPQELGSIIGSQNVLNHKNGYEYFLNYPFQIEYGYKLVYPKFVLKIGILRKNKSGNFEK